MTAVAPARSRTRRWLAGAGIALAAVLLIAIPVREAVNRATVSNRKVQCANNLKNIGGMIQERMVHRTSRLRTDTTGILFAYNLGLIRRGDERVFVCPLDPSGGDRMAAWSMRTTLPHEAEDADVLTSYLTSDFAWSPLPRCSSRKWPLAACLHHPDGVLMLYDDSSVVFHDREALGLGPDDPIETGPDSKCEALRAFPARRTR